MFSGGTGREQWHEIGLLTTFLDELQKITQKNLEPKFFLLRLGKKLFT